MRYRTLGNTGTVVSVHCLGTMTFGSEADEETSGAIIRAYLDAGGNFLDTANVYSGNESERIIGRWLKANRAAADQVVIATKGRFPQGGGPNDVGLSRRHLSRALDASLERLGVESVDLYQTHAWDALTPIEETLRFLDDAVTAGKIKAYGFSNYLGYQLTKAAFTARQNHWAAPATLQPQYSLLVRGIEHEIVPAALDERIGLLPWSPLGGGWLSGKYQRDTPPTGASRLGDEQERGMEAWSLRKDDEHVWAVIDAVREVADQAGTTSAAVALAWLDAQPGVTSTILGARNVDQLQQNLAAADLQLGQDALDRLTEVSTPRTEVYPYGPLAVQQRHRPIVQEG